MEFYFNKIGLGILFGIFCCGDPISGNEPIRRQYRLLHPIESVEMTDAAAAAAAVRNKVRSGLTHK